MTAPPVLSAPGRPSSRSGDRDERGRTTLEVVLTAPALLLTLMLIVQIGLLFHAQNVAENAAQEGAAAARSFDGDEAQAKADTLSALAALGPNMFTDRAVQVDRGQETATVTVTGTVVSLIPFVDLTVSESATGPIERFISPPGSESP